MKKMIMIFIMTLFFLPIHNKTIEYNFSEIKNFIFRKSNIPISLMMVESRFNEKAFNKKENAAGVLQIRPIMVREVNRIIGYDKYKLDDRFNFEKSLEMFYIFQDHWNPYYNPEKASRLWNGGENGMNKKATLKYYKEFLKYYNKWQEN